MTAFKWQKCEIQCLYRKQTCLCVFFISFILAVKIKQQQPDNVCKIWQCVSRAGLFTLSPFVLKWWRMAGDNLIFTQELHKSMNRKLFFFCILFFPHLKAKHNKSAVWASSCITVHAHSNPISCQMPKEGHYMGNKGGDGITEFKSKMRCRGVGHCRKCNEMPIKSTENIMWINNLHRRSTYYLNRGN